MIITITERWRIKSDRHCWSTEQRSKSKTGTPPVYSWKGTTFHDSLPAAIKWMGELFAREDPLETDSLVEALNRVSAIHEEIAAMLSEAPQAEILSSPPLLHDMDPILVAQNGRTA
jgi:hypothetical protein